MKDHLKERHKMSDVAIVILNWNGKKFLEDFLPSVIKNSSKKNTRIIVADNNSDDDSVEFLEKEFPRVERMLFDKNYGFAGGYNKALMELEADYFLLLNSDVEVMPGWLDPLVKLLDSNPLIAACSPKIRDYNHKDFYEYAGAAGGFIDKYAYAFCRGRIFDSLETDYGQYDNQKDILWATGACMLIRAELFKLSGGFDSSYFAHFEEIDLCWRLKNRGYRIVFTPDSLVYHVGGGTLPASNPWKTYLNFRNNLFTLYKNSGPESFAKRIIVRLLLDGISGLRFISQLKFRDFYAILRAHFAFYSRIPGLRKFRKREKNFIKTYDHKEIYRGSLVKDYFLKSKKSYLKLKWN